MNAINSCCPHSMVKLIQMYPMMIRQLLAMIDAASNLKSLIEVMKMQFVLESGDYGMRIRQNKRATATRLHNSAHSFFGVAGHLK